MFNKTVFSARNPVAAMGYALMAYATSAAVFAAGVSQNQDGLSVVRVFLNNISGILNAASVVVVTVAIVFAGYQIAFAHKRLSDVAPVLIGGLLIGGAAAIASWFTVSWAGTTTC